ncbi:hypothetical protein BCR37DRAFT_383767 [Protomyces lactucae-debilis]|uniref:Secreted protein n=1 Tax=Protomyces lactucae-debilis TaxID=2754530 RepID=A0A1Y2EX73_PROLT|nr:uncharacterized protein BCR37DRAFT_383767 [Protomyces lactucae-debilis]ORY76097.1 hypothetical protein BCR37DRAFT_383767 [Protomyces lactucae-debilis]
MLPHFLQLSILQLVSMLVVVNGATPNKVPNSVACTGGRTIQYKELVSDLEAAPVARAWGCPSRHVGKHRVTDGEKRGHSGYILTYYTQVSGDYTANIFCHMSLDGQLCH